MEGVLCAERASGSSTTKVFGFPLLIYPYVRCRILYRQQSPILGYLWSDSIKVKLKALGTRFGGVLWQTVRTETTSQFEVKIFVSYKQFKKLMNDTVLWLWLMHWIML